MKLIKSIKRSLLIAVAVPLVTASGAAAIEPGLPGTLIPGNSLFVTGNSIWLQFLGGYAHYDVDLFIFDFVGQDHTEVPVIFNNHLSTVGEEYRASGFTPGEELIFGIFVRNTEETYYSGPAGGNPDGFVHIQFFETSDGVFNIGVGFEDLMLPDGDGDYQDIFFRVGGVSIVPEPVTLVLLASGLFGLGGVGLMRRRRGAELDDA